MATIENIKKTSGFFSAMVVIIVLTFILGGLVIRAQVESVLRINKEVQGNQATLSAYDQKIKDLEELKGNYLALESKNPDFRKTILGVLPESSDEERMLVALRNIATAIGISIKEVAITRPTVPEQTPTVQFDIEANGVSFGQLHFFFRLLEATSRVERTSTLSLTGRNNALTAKIQIFFYYQPLTVGVK